MLRLAAASSAALLAAACVPSRDLGAGGGGGTTTTTTSTRSGAGGSPHHHHRDGDRRQRADEAAADRAHRRQRHQRLRRGADVLPPGDTPWPAAAGGLAFGTGQAVDIATALPSGLDVTPWVVSGNLEATAGMTCTQMLALAQP